MRSYMKLFTNKKAHYQPAFFTIEASLLIPFIIFVIASFIVFAIYMHDKVTFRANSIYYVYNNYDFNSTEIKMSLELNKIAKEKSILKDFSPKIYLTDTGETLNITIGKKGNLTFYHGLNSESLLVYDTLLKLLIQRMENKK